jgi:hypothetical protein
MVASHPVVIGSAPAFPLGRRLCEHALGGGAEELVTAPAAKQVVVQLDVGMLMGEDQGGRCELEDGGPCRQRQLAS